MAKIICITSGLRGIVNASFELIRRLKTDGHDLIYASPRPIEALVAAQAIEFYQLDFIPAHPKVELPEFKGPLKKLSKLFFKYKNKSTLQQEALNALKPEDFKKLLSEANPDLLLIDIELHEYIIECFAQKVPFVMLSQWFTLWKNPDLPYLLHDTIPGKGFWGSKTGLSISWQLVQIKRWWMFKKLNLRFAGTDRRSTLLAFANKRDFPLEWIKENYWPGPFSYSQLTVISMTMDQLEFPHDPRENLHYVGAMVDESRKEYSNDEDLTYSIEEVLEYSQKINAKLICCTVSTLHAGDISFLKKVIQAVRRNKNWVTIIGLGGKIDKKTLGDLPGNVFAFRYLPQLKVLSQSHCSINHGGIHTINECIHFKVPMVVYSGKRSDQNGCAARVHYHELGIMADKDKDDAETIKQKLIKVLNDKKYQTALEKIHQDYLNFRTEKKLEKIIQLFLTQQHTTIQK